MLANLTAGEILEQLYHANQIEQIRNVVFMGMGEPLDNYQAVIQSIEGMRDVQMFSLASNQICVSTVGVVPRLRTLAKDVPGVALALSLHAPTQDMRQKIVPTSAAWPLHKIMEALDEFLRLRKASSTTASKKSKVKVMIEYVLIADINDSLEAAHELGRLLQGRPVVVNVIPYNPTDVPHDYKTPARAVSDAFCDAVRSHGLMTILRQTLGDDVSGACGQLVLDTRKKDGKRARVALCLA